MDIGATTTSVTCVDEGLLNADTRIKLDYGGDDITAALVALLTRANFPYKELDLARAMDWAMMDKLKEKIATLEEVSFCFPESAIMDAKLTFLAYGGKCRLGHFRAKRTRFDAEVQP